MKVVLSLTLVLAFGAVGMAGELPRASSKSLPAALRAIGGTQTDVLSRADASAIRGEGGSCPCIDTHKHQRGLGHQKCKTNHGHTK